jgi:benzoyl-CoA reductase/2-hydroxyglutaryl-CoA dehydratase subunit BcrC/BadD/HgdB
MEIVWQITGNIPTVFSKIIMMSFKNNFYSLLKNFNVEISERCNESKQTQMLIVVIRIVTFQISLCTVIHSVREL